MIRRPPRSTLFPLHDALPIWHYDMAGHWLPRERSEMLQHLYTVLALSIRDGSDALTITRSEEHTSELQSRQYLVFRLLLAKKKIRYRDSSMYLYSIINLIILP